MPHKLNIQPFQFAEIFKNTRLQEGYSVVTKMPEKGEMTTLKLVFLMFYNKKMKNNNHAS